MLQQIYRPLPYLQVMLRYHQAAPKKQILLHLQVLIGYPKANTKGGGDEGEPRGNQSSLKEVGEDLYKESEEKSKVNKGKQFLHIQYSQKSEINSIK